MSHAIPVRCRSVYACTSECCGEELWTCDRDKGHSGEHMNVMVWPQDSIKEAVDFITEQAAKTHVETNCFPKETASVQIKPEEGARLCGWWWCVAEKRVGVLNRDAIFTVRCNRLLGHDVAHAYEYTEDIGQ